MHILAPGMKQRLKEHERTCKHSEGMLDLSQNSSHTHLTRHCPALLRKTCLWSFAQKRLVLPLEHLEMQGYPVLQPAHGYTTHWAATIKEMSPTVVKSMAGNGMRASSIASVIMFLLAGIREVY
eukprot:1603909-Alexandrium_andersonii.AAC.1